MITVIDAGALQGYSGVDHLISDNTADIIGKEFRSVEEALRAADKLVSINGCPHPYTWVTCLMARGNRVTRKSV